LSGSLKNSTANLKQPYKKIKNPVHKPGIIKALNLNIIYLKNMKIARPSKKASYNWLGCLGSKFGSVENIIAQGTSVTRP
jgi:hypothetical protein